ncbi:MAG: Ig-like domain-containing protein, partial [Acidobacteriota bacterium]
LPGLSLSPDGSFAYTPAIDANGVVSFTYKANDGLADSNVATVAITVLPIDDVPVAVDDSYTTIGSGLLTVAASSGVLINDLDVDTATADLTAILVAGASNGTVSLNGDGSFTYDPAPDFYGQDEFSYKANDGTSDSNVATVTLGVQYGFIGLLSPWKPPSPQPYTIKLGSAFPVRWQYADPATDLVIESSGAQPTVEVLGPLSSCSASGDGSEPIQIFSPGNSTYQYDTRLDIHQLNVDSNNLVVNKCYDAYVHSGVTGQLNGPFIFKVKR